MLKNKAPESVLFYLPGTGFEAAIAKGEANPNFNVRTSLVDDGPFGGAISCDNKVRLSYRAPGNVYGERGTLSFFWRARRTSAKAVASASMAAEEAKQARATAVPKSRPRTPSDV